VPQEWTRALFPVKNEDSLGPALTWQAHGRPAVELAGYGQRSPPGLEIPILGITACNYLDFA
jgi:hypothetical protein